MQTVLFLGFHGLGPVRLLHRGFNADPRSGMIILLILVIIVAIYLHRRR
ncbi:hypothetical protein [Furfurilactobacillus siliginis]|uniref:Uncharacterized protein n=1 Tax=Furfurilactobacillus siliginis TaxID=348151 RepID=A0A510VRK9_9LACO|nr:hypothetical protein [Furfurilactobacillus siliginis]GEK29588.1 hypothetical protein LSI01_18990 [Furfurilactobacillus siliginis]